MVVACGMRRHQRCIGKRGSTLERPEMKWHFQVSMAFSAALVRCMFGGAS